MGLTVTVDPPELLPELVDELLRSGCIAHVVNKTTVRVVHVDARASDEAHSELLFFLRAWQRRHPGADVQLPR